MPEFPELDQFPIKTYDKIRYADTDRQGHVNNEVFANLLETGRVEILYNPDNPLACKNCSFVIVSLTLNFHAEITWPGIVEIDTRVAKLGRSSITIEQGLFQDGTCVATASTVIVHMRDDVKRSEPLNDLAMSFLNGLF
ncbi:MAG: acyl-CoA thioesterase [Anaerolineales bacterium]|jgi:acyl-CoA thioester hydrolase